jgi:prephenate dehydrogenase
VAATEDTFKAIRHLLTPQTLLMDVGSTKGDVVAAAQRVLRDQLAGFVPAHPIAGKEVAGVEHADPALYQDRQVILTPTEHTAPAQADRAEQVWRALGARVLRMSPQDHDATYAAVSHLPHLLAFAYINGLAAQPQGAHFLSMAGPGFRDFSRIAASDPQVWRDILLANAEEVLRQGQYFRAALDALEHAVREQRADLLVPLIEQARALRAPWQMPATPKSAD